MSYSQFTTIEAVQEIFGVRITSDASLFPDIPPITISSRLQDLLQEQTSALVQSI
ncbi:MAG: hypothetical protein AAGD25_41445 [Cyanobacteria bacterium P01_F01_bin.150]